MPRIPVRPNDNFLTKEHLTLNLAQRQVRWFSQVTGGNVDNVVGATSSEGFSNSRHPVGCLHAYLHCMTRNK